MKLMGKHGNMKKEEDYKTLAEDEGGASTIEPLAMEDM